MYPHAPFSSLPNITLVRGEKKRHESDFTKNSANFGAEGKY
jgi:hypothetical protein